MSAGQSSGFPEFPGCFVCGQQNAWGLQTRFYPTETGTRAEFRPLERHTGYENKVHGGIISALLDEALIWAAYSRSGDFGLTAEITVRFMRPLVTEAAYTVSGAVKTRRGRLTIASARIVNSSGDVMAEAAGKVIHSTQDG